MAHIYDWARGRGYWVRPGPQPQTATHLLLDGGKLCVPDESHAAFINAYAASLVRCPERRPCVVELRTPVFKMFVDLDTRFGSVEEAERARRTGMEDLVRALTGQVCSVTKEAARALVCACNVPKREEAGTWKLGFHVVWPDVLVTPEAALRLLEVFSEQLPPPQEYSLVETWGTILDKSVYKGNGLRMPWSAKGRGDGRFYELAFVLGDEYRRVGPMGTVSELRDAVRALSIRTFGVAPTIDVQSTSQDSQRETLPTTHHHVSAYSDVLDKVAGVLPVQFLGQKFTGIIATEHCFMLRSTARYCINLGRAHRTNNVYFMLTKRGVCQRCYCRCETTEGRKYGMCKDFTSEYWTVPTDVLRAFFPDVTDDAHAHPSSVETRTVGAMPSRAGKAFLSFDSLASRSRPPLGKRKKRA